MLLEEDEEPSFSEVLQINANPSEELSEKDISGICFPKKDQCSLY